MGTDTYFTQHKRNCVQCSRYLIFVRFRFDGTDVDSQCNQDKTGTSSCIYTFAKCTILFLGQLSIPEFMKCFACYTRNLLKSMKALYNNSDWLTQF